MRIRFVSSMLLLIMLAASSCSSESPSQAPQYSFPLVQKYTTQAGDLFYFRPLDGQFVLLERRKALAIAVAPERRIQAYSYENRITLSRPEGEYLVNTTFVSDISPQVALAITANGRTLASGDRDGVVSVWDTETGSRIRLLNLPGPIRSLAISRDGFWLAVGLGRPYGELIDTVWLYDMHSREPRMSFGRLAVEALAWSKDGRWLAAGLDDGAVLLRDAGTQAEPQRVSLSTSPIRAVAIHPSGQFMASAHADKRVLLSKFPSGEHIFTFEPPLPPNPLFPKGTEKVAFDEQGNRLAVAYADGDFAIWDTTALSR